MVETSKWVRVMADYCSDGVWQENGAMASAEELPISSRLLKCLRLWCGWFERSEFYLPEAERSIVFDTEAFAAEGLLIAQAMKAELPDWTVIYFDAARVDHSKEHQPRSQFEYEVTA